MEYCCISQTEAEQFFRYMLSGSYEVNSSLNWIKNDEWFVSRLFILQMETAGIETIRVANIFMFVLGFVGSSLPEFFITVFC